MQTRLTTFTTITRVSLCFQVHNNHGLTFGKTDKRGGPPKKGKLKRPTKTDG